MKKLRKADLNKHKLKPYYALGRILKRPRGYSKCQNCGIIIHDKDREIIKPGDGSCE